MYVSLGRRWGSKFNAGAPVRQPLVDAHEGTAGDWLRRHERAAAEAVQRGKEGVREIGPFLLRRAADTRNLYLAWENLRREGGSAPGPNGLSYEDLDCKEVRELLRALSRAIRNGTYRTGPDRKVSIPKSSGRGRRTLRIQNVEDRTVARAIVQVIQPLLDPQFDDHSYGFRPGRDRCHALAEALQLAKEADRWAWVVEDIKDAFDNVPRKRMLDALRKRLPGSDDPKAGNLLELIEHVIEAGTKRGLRQGSPLSPLMLNVYLDQVLERVWRRRFPDVPLIRTADDMLVLCRTDEEAEMARQALQETLSPAGMPLKESKNSSIRQLNMGDDADWLGFLISKGKDEPEIRIAERAWDKLREAWERAHTRPGSPLLAVDVLNGWLDQVGPCFADEVRDQVFARVSALGRELAFDELPERDVLLRRWQTAYVRWCRLRRGTTGQAPSAGDGSACRQLFSLARKPRGDGASPGAPSPSSLLTGLRADSEVIVYTDGSCNRFTRIGGWAAILKFPGQSLQPIALSAGLRRTTNNRAELIAVIQALTALPSPARVTIVTDSRYVSEGIERLDHWKSQGWRVGSGRHKRPLRNADLWQQLDSLLTRHTVRCQWVEAHAGHSENELCDRMAQAAASFGCREDG